MNDPKNEIAKIESEAALKSVETASTAVAEQAKALVFSHYELALRRPRDIDQCRQSLLKECRRPSFAAIALYNKPIGNGIVGLSIRFAEAAIRFFKNVVVMTQTVYDDIERRIVNVKVIDVESNVSYNIDITVTKTVERKSIKQGDQPVSTRINSKGQLLYIIPATDDDILNKQNALISKAIRTLSLRLIPADILEECMDAVFETQKNEAAADPDAAKRKIFDSFESIGVQLKDIKDYLGHNAETLTPKELVELRGLFLAIKDGEASWREAIDKKRDPPKDDKKPEPTGKGVTGAAERVGVQKPLI